MFNMQIQDVTSFECHLIGGMVPVNKILTLHGGQFGTGNAQDGTLAFILCIGHPQCLV